MPKMKLDLVRRSGAAGSGTAAARVPAVRRGEIWLAALDPTIGAEIQKTRPCVVVSPPERRRHRVGSFEFRGTRSYNRRRNSKDPTLCRRLSGGDARFSAHCHSRADDHRQPSGALSHTLPGSHGLHAFQVPRLTQPRSESKTWPMTHGNSSE